MPTHGDIQPTVITLHEAEGRIVAIEGDVEALYGFDRAEAMAVNPYAWLHPEDIPTISMFHELTLNGEAEGKAIRYRRKLPSGGYRWLQSTHRLLKGPPARIQSITCSVSTQSAAAIVATHEKAPEPGF